MKGVSNKIMSAFPFLFLFNSDRFLFEKLLCKCSECMSVTRDRGKLGNDSSLLQGGFAKLSHNRRKWLKMAKRSKFPFLDKKKTFNQKMTSNGRLSPRNTTFQNHLISGQKHEVELYEQVREKVQNL